MKKNPKIAIVYDRVNKFGGAEHVLQSLHAAFPEAPLYTSVFDPRGAAWVKDWHVIPSFLQRFPLVGRHEILAPLMPVAFESFDFSAYDIVISVTSEAAKGIITKPETLHICYLLTPTRYLWSHEEEYVRQKTGIFLRLFSGYLKRWDKVASTRPDVVIPISKRVQERINMYYKRVTDDVLYPPVDVSKFSGPVQPYRPGYNYALVVSRLVGYKRIDLAIAACKELKRHLVIVGAGSGRKRLERLAARSPYIHFLGYVKEHALPSYFAGASVFLSLADEDFGIAAAEALASGVPVVCYRKSGTYETIRDGETGVAFERQRSEDVSRALERMSAIQWDSSVIRKSVRRFNEGQFRKEWVRRVNELWQRR